MGLREHASVLSLHECMHGLVSKGAMRGEPLHPHASGNIELPGAAVDSVGAEHVCFPLAPLTRPPPSCPQDRVLFIFP